MREPRIGLISSLVLGASLAAGLVGCGSHPIKPESENVKITRDDADEDCREIGPVEGRNSSVKGTFDQALEDLKIDAARKGANFVKIGATSGPGTAVHGVAYFCP
ncbi:MAG: hypothetical protein J0L82_03265 [Deltaproteobacteria bacterium]|nr:hypothetical protein [Deltaproteobacteria bacterium]